MATTPIPFFAGHASFHIVLLPDSRQEGPPVIVISEYGMARETARIYSSKHNKKVADGHQLFPHKHWFSCI